MSRFIEKELIRKFKDREPFTREDLFDFYRHFEPDLKKGTFGWRVYNLKNKSIIRPIKKDMYVISHKHKYKPNYSPEFIKVSKITTDKYENVKNCIWETEWLNEFSLHQSNKQMIIIEIEKDFIESLYFELKDSITNEVFLNPDEKTINFYIAESTYPIIIKKLITRSPIARKVVNKAAFYTPEVEKILVDIFADDKLFYYLQGSELVHIYDNLMSKYTINFTKLFSYAKRREKEQHIKQFLTNHLYHHVKDIIE